MKLINKSAVDSFHNQAIMVGLLQIISLLILVEYVGGWQQAEGEI